jgi:molybdopterin-binding protein
VCCQFDLGFNISVITKESAENPELAVGKSAYAVIKASNVMIGVD